jgi:hypothetical protein
MVYFRTKNPILSKFLRVLEWKVLLYFMTVLVYFDAIWYILRQFCILVGHLVYLFLEKSGNLASLLPFLRRLADSRELGSKERGGIF